MTNIQDYLTEENQNNIQLGNNNKKKKKYNGRKRDYTCHCQCG